MIEVRILCFLHPLILPIKAIAIRMNPIIKNGKGTMIPALGAGMHLVPSSFKVSPSLHERSTI